METNEFINKNQGSTNKDMQEFIDMMESYKTCTSSILLKSANLMPAEILAQLNIPDEYSSFFTNKK
jgi:hypothetical protein